MTARIVSLLPSATELVCALGLEDHLVGRSHECDYPTSITQLPVCTEPKFDVHGNSLELDTQVKDLLKDSLSVYRVRTETLKELHPDVIVTQTQCDVCAVNLHDVEVALGSWLGKKPAIASLQATDVSGVWKDLRIIAVMLGLESRANEVIATLETHMQQIARQTKTLHRNPRAVCIEWMDPLMAAGNWVPELVRMAGGTDLFGQAGQHAPWITWDRLRTADPDMILLMPCGFSLAKIAERICDLTSNPNWHRLSAVRNGQVYATDGNQFFNRPGPRLVESLEILAEIFHPDTFGSNHQGTGWIPVQSE